MNIIVRAIKPGEGRGLLDLVLALATSHGRADFVRAQAEDYERAIFNAHPIVGAFVAEVDGVLGGSAFWHRSFSTFAGREILYLEDLSVLPQFQRQGLGRMLIKHIAQFAIAQNFAYVKWDMMNWNSSGQRFYESIGAEFDPGYTQCRLQGAALRNFAQ